MIKKSKRPCKGLTVLALIGLLTSIEVRADIIDDIEELEKPKKKTKTEEEQTSSEPAPEDSKSQGQESASPRPESRPSTTTAPGEKPPLPSKSENPSKASEPAGDKTSGSSPSTASSQASASANKAEREARRKIPIHLASEGTSTYSQNGSSVHLEKNVVITQDDIRIQANEAKIKMGKESGGVELAEMIGKVSMVHSSKDPAERITAYGDHAIFENNNQLITLEGNARLLRDGHLVKGDRIIYEIISGMVKVDRVQGVVRPERAEK